MRRRKRPGGGTIDDSGKAAVIEGRGLAPAIVNFSSHERVLAMLWTLRPVLHISAPAAAVRALRFLPSLNPSLAAANHNHRADEGGSVVGVSPGLGNC